MRKICFVIMLTVCFFNMQAQRQYFIYLQSETKQPFFVKLNNSKINSSSYGYLIIPKLADSTYQIGIGQQNDQSFTYNFEIKLNQKDHGYLIKNMGEKGLGLFDQQSLALLMPVNSKVSKEVSSPNPENNSKSFSDILSKASNDPALKEKTANPVAEKKNETEISTEKKETKQENMVVQPAEKKEAVSNPVRQQNEAIISDSLLKADENAKPVLPVVNNVESNDAGDYKKTVIVRKSESSTTQGFGLVYLDQYANGNTDTIKLLIPNAPKVFQSNTPSNQQEDKKFIELKSDTIQKKESEKIQDAQKVVAAEKVNTALETKGINNCVAVAADQDFFSLRKQMAAAEGNEQMINVASAFFKKSCFTTVQIKNLSFLFLDDEGKYRFFDQAYTHVVDVENFKTLQSEIKDEYYLNRFKAMLRN